MKNLLLLASVVTFIFCFNIAEVSAADKKITIGVPEGLKFYGDLRGRAEWDK